MRVKTAGSAFEHCWFVTLTYDNEHIPLFNCEVSHSEYDNVLSDSGVVYGYEKHSFIPVSKYCCTDSQQLRHIYFTQVQGTIPYNRETAQHEPVEDSWFLSMDAIRSFIAKTQSATPYGEKGELSARYGDNLIPFLNYVDVQNYIKRLRRHLDKYTNEKISFYAVGEYGPVHFRPHFHLLLFFNSQEIADVIRWCHNKSWKFGRSDIQRSNGGCASYVASYVNSLVAAPSLYRSCRAFKPRSRASLGFFEKGETFDEGEDVYAQIEQKIDSVINGREYNFNGIYRVINMPGIPMPSNRIELAELLWEHAGKPEPVSTALYSDIDEGDTDAQKAARWAVEQDLMKDDADNNKFHPAFPVSKLRTCLTWNAAKEKGLFDKTEE